LLWPKAIGRNGWDQVQQPAHRAGVWGPPTASARSGISPPRQQRTSYRNSRHRLRRRLPTGPVATTPDQLVYLLYALLALILVISLFGIANSLFLSIHERTREFGMLRAIGATRTQVRRIVRYESVITAAIGGLLGTGIGLLFAFLITTALSDLGLGFTVPVGQLGGFLVLAVLVGVVAAVIPARRGASIDVLEAMHHE
jgi:ABC-type antimicrobial peptide transport system permease subunit